MKTPLGTCIKLCYQDYLTNKETKLELFTKPKMIAEYLIRTYQDYAGTPQFPKLNKKREQQAIQKLTQKIEEDQ